MSRGTHLKALYLKMVLTLAEEEKQPQPSEAVITACQVAKGVIYREYQQLVPHG